MNYQSIYDRLISFRKQNPANGYVERHHILPRALGGLNDSSNLVVLTGREHWIAHLLLWKINPCKEMAFACHRMTSRCKERGIPLVKNSRMYEKLRIECAKQHSLRGKKNVGERNPSFGSRWVSNFELKQNRKISKGESIPSGWVLGRNCWSKKPKRILTSKERSERMVRWNAERSAKDKESTLQKLKTYRPSAAVLEKLKDRRKDKNPTYGLRFRWANDGYRNYRFPLNEPLPDNLTLGKIKRDISLCGKTELS